MRKRFMAMNTGRHLSLRADRGPRPSPRTMPSPLAKVGDHLGAEAADAGARRLGIGTAAEAHVEDHLVAAALALVAAQLRDHLLGRPDEEAVGGDARVGPLGLALDARERVAAEAPALHVVGAVVVEADLAHVRPPDALDLGVRVRDESLAHQYDAPRPPRAPRLGAEELGHAAREREVVEAVADPRVGEPRRAAHGGLGARADPERRARALHRPRPDREGVEREVLSGEAHDAVLEGAAHDLEALLEARDRLGARGAEGAQLGLLPA